MLSMLVALLQRHGLDVAPKLPALHAEVQPWVVDALHSTKDTRTRLTLVNYVRFMLQLDAVQVCCGAPGCG